MCMCSVMSDSVTPWNGDCQAPPFMGFPRKESWSELPLPSPQHLSNPGIEPVSPALHMDFLPLCHLGSIFHYIPFYIFSTLTIVAND